MATWDKTDLLAKVKKMARRPTTDEETSDAEWYDKLTQAEAYWKPVLAAVYPYNMFEAPTVMTAGSGNLTYTFAGDITPLAVQIFSNNSTSARPLRVGAFWDQNADYVWEGSQIRIPQNRTKSFTPYARYVLPPGDIDASTDSTINPNWVRSLLVTRAVALWATEGGKRNPAPFYQQEQRLWAGNPSMGDIGILGALKMQNPMYGAAAVASPSGLHGLAGVDTGSGYTAI